MLRQPLRRPDNYKARSDGAWGGDEPQRKSYSGGGGQHASFVEWLRLHNRPNYGAARCYACAFLGRERRQGDHDVRDCQLVQQALNKAVQLGEFPPQGEPREDRQPQRGGHNPRGSGYGGPGRRFHR